MTLNDDRYLQPEEPDKKRITIGMSVVVTYEMEVVIDAVDETDAIATFDDMEKQLIEKCVLHGERVEVEINKEYVVDP